MPRPTSSGITATVVFAVALTVPPIAGLALEQATELTLANGLRVLVLEDRTQPLVSTQVTYRAGARNEAVGATGVAHFLEHMAFRASAGFPGTEAVQRIYDAGGEWHAYTWTDETAYFETVPVEELDLALAIQADRMARLLLPEGEIEAERGAVTAELRGYEQDPAVVLWDAVLAVSFLQHPYRYNTIGWPSDVGVIGQVALRDFYQRAYAPANAVLAVVGDVTVAEVEERVRHHFGGLLGGAPLPLPPTREPPQTGVRRIELAGDGNRFQIVYRAPAFSDPEAPAFLLLQAWLGGSEGVSFLQMGGGHPVEPGRPLAELGLDMTTWYPPSAAPYVFAIAGDAPEHRRGEVEAAVEQRIAWLRDTELSTGELAELRRELADELWFDVETTEDAAHELSFFAALEALPARLELPRRLEAVVPGDLVRVANLFLRPEQRTIGWSGTSPPDARPLAVRPGSRRLVAAPPTASAVQSQVGRLTAPSLERLVGGLPLLVQVSPRSPTGHVRLLIRGRATVAQEGVEVEAPVWRHTSLGARFVSGGLLQALYAVRAAFSGATDTGVDDNEQGSVEAALEGALWGPEEPLANTPVVLAVAGDVALDEVHRAAQRVFGAMVPAGRLPRRPTVAPTAFAAIPGNGLLQLGWGVRIPPTATVDGLAARMALWVLSHGYEGRLGHEAIHRRGLVYAVDAEDREDGRDAWLSLVAAVEPQSAAALRKLVRTELGRLGSEPPSASEVEAATRARLGRRRTAAQSPSELTRRLVGDWALLGRVDSPEALGRRLTAVDGREVARAAQLLAQAATAEGASDP